MGLAKKPTKVIQTEPGEDVDAVNSIITELESGTQAALDRLKVAEPKTEKPAYKQRDFDKEARGKTRCALYEAALMSPAIAGMQWNGTAEFKKLIREMADDGVAYTFEE